MRISQSSRSSIHAIFYHIQVVILALRSLSRLSWCSRLLGGSRQLESFKDGDVFTVIISVLTRGDQIVHRYRSVVWIRLHLGNPNNLSRALHQTWLVSTGFASPSRYAMAPAYGFVLPVGTDYLFTFGVTRSGASCSLPISLAFIVVELSRMALSCFSGSAARFPHPCHCYRTQPVTLATVVISSDRLVYTDLEGSPQLRKFCQPLFGGG